MGQLFQQYKDYNLVNVVLISNGTEYGTEYRISNINTKGNPPEFCGAHLESLSIEDAAVGTNNVANIGASGTVTVVDYKDSVFNFLSAHLTRWLNKGNNPAVENTNNLNQFLPRIKIEITCLSGKKSWFGYITDWKFNYVGRVPNITISWNVTGAGVVPTQSLPPAKYTSVAKLLKDIQNNFKDTPVGFYFIDDTGTYENEDAANKLVFIKTDNSTEATTANASIDTQQSLQSGSINFDLSKIASTGNCVIDAYNFITTNTMTFDGDYVSGRIENDKNFKESYIVSRKGVGKNNAKVDQGVDAFLFVFNGKQKPYSEIEVDDGSGKKYKGIVIQVESFQFDTEFTLLSLQSSLTRNQNGTINVDNTGQSTTNGSQSEEAAALQSKAASIESEPINIDFECYNCVDFYSNNTCKPFTLLVYNECGNLHPVSGIFTVKSISYSIGNSAVVKASIKGTKEFNSIVNQNIQEASKIESEDSETN